MRIFRILFAVLAMMLAMTAHADAVAGKDFKLLDPPQPTTAGKKVEVLEFFFYGCSHCYHLHPLLSAWEKKKPADVDLQLVPVIFRDEWEPMSRTFYALDSLGQLGKLHDPLFEAWNVFNKYLVSEDQIAEFVAGHGVNQAKFKAAYNSFAVNSKVLRSKQMLSEYGIRGTPTLVIDGKYVVTGLGPDETIRVLDEVIKIARKERNKR